MPYLEPFFLPPPPPVVSWFFVAVPGVEAYERAAWDAYTNLANEWMWGAEVQAPNSAAIRQDWLQAIDLTLEAYEMGFPTILLDHIDEIETILRTMQGEGCCDNQLTLLPPEPVENPDDLGYDDPPPAEWGDGEPVADVDDWHDILCGAAHDYLDLLIYQANQMDSLVINSLLTIAAIGTILAALATVGLSLLIEAALAAGIFTAITGAWVNDLFADAGEAIDSVREEIICAVLTSNPQAVADEIEAAVSATAWTVFFQWLDYESAVNTMLYGGHEGEFMEVRRGESCPCDSYTFDHTFTFDSDQDFWATTNGAWDSDSGEGTIKLSGGLAGMKLFYGDEGIPGRGLMDALGLTHPQKFIIELVRVRVRTEANGAGMDLYLQGDDGIPPLHETVWAAVQTTGYTNREADDLAGWDEYTTVSEFDNRRAVDFVLDPISGTNVAYITSVRVAGQVEAG